LIQFQFTLQRDKFKMTSNLLNIQDNLKYLKTNIEDFTEEVIISNPGHRMRMKIILKGVILEHLTLSIKKFYYID